MKIYTKRGDDGTTGLLNSHRVKKYSLRIECFGTIDELNSIVGLARASNEHKELDDALKSISHTLFNLGSDLATPQTPTPKFRVVRVKSDSTEYLEKLIDDYTAVLPKLKHFILPGGCMCASFLHQARTVCRRAERLIVKLESEEDIGTEAVKYVNRLSDYFFTAARYSNFLTNIPDVEWEK